MGGSLKKQSMVLGSRMKQNPYLEFPGAVHYISFGKEDCRVACKEIRQRYDTLFQMLCYLILIIIIWFYCKGVKD